MVSYVRDDRLMGAFCTLPWPSASSSATTSYGRRTRTIGSRPPPSSVRPHPGEDRWSDIDLALGIRPALEPEAVARRWTERMYGDHGAVHHLDWWIGSALYRIFLLPNVLQIDLSFWPSGDFAASGPAFRLLFGEANDAPGTSLPSSGPLVGMGWLYGRAAKSSLARGRRWQAVHT